MAPPPLSLLKVLTSGVGRLNVSEIGAARRAAAFPGPVYLLNGDSHQYNVDHPTGSGSSWLSFYGVDEPADNLTRITVDGSTGVDDYLRMRVDPHDSAVLTWEKVPFSS